MSAEAAARPATLAPAGRPHRARPVRVGRRTAALHVAEVAAALEAAS